jgi:phosphoribosylaminoimidazole-succinocarboxamide synthase
MSYEVNLEKPDHSGKVRDSYYLSDTEMMVVASDRVSVFDVVLPTPIPDKGKRLTQVSAFWMREFFSDVNNHLITTDLPKGLEGNPDLDGRSSVVRRAEMIPLECIVRGYLYGSVMNEYKEHGTATGIVLPKGLVKASQLPEPVFTPSTKATVGHDENITADQARDLVGGDTLWKVRDLSLEIYARAAKYALEKGIILADTKFEFGFVDGHLTLCDEILTPDSSRYWDAESYKPGTEPVSFDKQYVRDYCAGLGWGKTPPGPELPDDVVSATQEKYAHISRLLVAQ